MAMYSCNGYLLMESCDQPQFTLQAGASLLCCNKLQKILMLHARGVENLPLALPRLLILAQERQKEDNAIV